MKSILLITLFLFVSVINGKNVYSKYIGTTWAIKQQDLNTCKTNCGTCCISSFIITQNGQNGAGMTFYFDGSTITRCRAISNGPFSLSFNMLNDNPLTVDGFSSVGTAAKLQLYPDGITVTYNDSSRTSCYGGALLVGTLNPNSSLNLIPHFGLVISILFFLF